MTALTQKEAEFTREMGQIAQMMGAPGATPRVVMARIIAEMPRWDGQAERPRTEREARAMYLKAVGFVTEGGVAFTEAARSMYLARLIAMRDRIEALVIEEPTNTVMKPVPNATGEAGKSTAFEVAKITRGSRRGNAALLNQWQRLCREIATVTGARPRDTMISTTRSLSVSLPGAKATAKMTATELIRVINPDATLEDIPGSGAGADPGRGEIVDAERVPVGDGQDGRPEGPGPAGPAEEAGAGPPGGRDGPPSGDDPPEQPRGADRP